MHSQHAAGETEKPTRHRDRDPRDRVGMDIWHSSAQCPNCGKIFGSARDWVTAGTIETGLGIGTVVAAPAVPEIGAAVDVAKEEIVLAFADDPRAWQGTLDVVQGVFRPTSTPTTPEGIAIRIIMMYLVNRH